MEDQVRSILERPFPDDVLKQRVGPNGVKLTYAEVQSYIDRLNEAFSGTWSWELVNRQQVEDQIVVEGRLTAVGITKTGLGGTAITRRKDNNKMVSLADDIKTAEADALKRACRLFGIGRDMYASDGEAALSSPPPRSPGPMTSRPAAHVTTPATESPRITNAQIGKLRSLVAESGGDWADYRAAVREQHGTNVEYATRALGSTLIQDLIDSTAPARRATPANGNGHPNNGSGHTAGWRRP